MNSFASLFLTESEMNGSQRVATEPGEQSEYEYYEYDDEEDEDPKMMPEELDGWFHYTL